MFQAPKRAKPERTDGEIRRKRNQNRKPIPEQTIEYRGTVLAVAELPDQSVTPSMLGEFQMDLSTRKELPPKLSDEALLAVATDYLNQCSAIDASATYEGMLIQHIVPELMHRFRELQNTKKHTS